MRETMKNILLLEDLPEIRVWLRALVQRVFPAADIREAARVGDALRLVQTMRFDIALIDLGLPDGPGVDVVTRLRDLQPEAQSVVVTIHDDDEHLFPALQHGADGYLLKEDRFEVLVEELQKIVRGQPPLSPAIARRLLTHFRLGSSSDTQAPSAPFTMAGTPGASRPVPIEKPLDHERLTPRETEVLTYLSKGFTIKEIANLMGIKWFTVNDHIKSIYKKLNVSSRAEAAVLASKQGLV